MDEKEFWDKYDSTRKILLKKVCPCGCGDCGEYSHICEIDHHGQKCPDEYCLGE